MIFNKLESEIDFEQGKELERQLDSYARKLEGGAPAYRLNKDRVEVVELAADLALRPFSVRDTIAWHDQLEQMERQLKASRSYLIDGRHYYISTYNIVIETSDITETVVQTMVAIFVLLLIFIAITGRLVSRKILAPFYNSLETIKSFSVRDKKPLDFPHSKTEEFEKLNGFLHRMSVQLLKDYWVVKEFSENLSHEIHTPAAVVRGKLELLTNSPIDNHQAKLIEAAYQSNEKITRIVQSLSVLARLENQEFEPSEQIDFSKMVRQAVGDFEELVKMKEIAIHTEIEDGLYLTIHPYMAEILLQNLLTNAIKHNHGGGAISLSLTSEKLVIENTGEDSGIDVGEFFERFKKGEKASDSIGLGLSIVRQICIANSFQISYKYQQPFHRIEIFFEGPLQN